MPYKSETQRRFFNSPAGKEKIGEENAEHWNKESKGLKNLPEKVNDLDKAINMCDETWEQRRYNSNPPDKYKWKYSVRVRYGNRTEFVYGPREWPSQSKNISYVKSELKDWVKRNGKSNYEPYDIQFVGEYK